MTEQEAKEKPIHEVWEAFKSLDRQYQNGLDLAKRWSIAMGRPLEAAIKMNLSQVEPTWKMLRRVLLERCDNEFGVVISKSMITNRKSSDLSIMYDYEAKAWSSVLDFLAWELDRQTKEQEGGEG